MFESILCQVTEYNPEVLESLIGLAVDIAREGREGRRVGTLFTFGDENAVLARSRPLILDPSSGHPESSLHVTNLNLRGTIKELAQLDGGFVVSREGIFLSACRYLDAVAAEVDVPLNPQPLTAKGVGEWDLSGRQANVKEFHTTKEMYAQKKLLMQHGDM